MDRMRLSAAAAAASLLVALIPLHVSGGGLEIVEAAEDLYFVRGTVGNVAFLVTGEGVLVVDSGQFPDHGEAVLREIARVTDSPVEYLVLTHYHMDHVGGACAFPESATVAAHGNLPGNMRRHNEPRLRDLVENVYPRRIGDQERELASMDRGDEGFEAGEERLERLRKGLEEMRRTSLVYPDTTFERTMTITIGGRTVRLFHPGPAHTSCNTIVHFVDSKAVHMGDMLFYMRHPFIDARAGADTGNWIRALEDVLEWDVETVMPGHGGLTGRDGLEWEIGYLRELRREVAEALESGMTLEETLEHVEMEGYAEIEGARMLESGIAAVYRELAGTE